MLLCPYADGLCQLHTTSALRRDVDPSLFCLLHTFLLRRLALHRTPKTRPTACISSSLSAHLPCHAPSQMLRCVALVLLPTRHAFGDRGPGATFSNPFAPACYSTVQATGGCAVRLLPQAAGGMCSNAGSFTLSRSQESAQLHKGRPLDRSFPRVHLLLQKEAGFHYGPRLSRVFSARRQTRAAVKQRRPSHRCGATSPYDPTPKARVASFQSLLASADSCTCSAGRLAQMTGIYFRLRLESAHRVRTSGLTSFPPKD